MLVSKKRIENFVDAMRSVVGNAVKSAKVAEQSARAAHGEAAKLKREIDGLHEKLNTVVKFVDSLSTNGVVTAVNKLNTEVFKTRKEGGSTTYEKAMYAMSGYEMPEEATLAGKVEAIIEHLGLDVSVQPKKVQEAKPVAKKRAVTKKKVSKK